MPPAAGAPLEAAPVEPSGEALRGGARARRTIRTAPLRGRVQACPGAGKSPPELGAICSVSSERGKPAARYAAGRFVAASGGEQFALAGAVEMLRRTRRDPQTDDWVVLSAADPLNPRRHTDPGRSGGGRAHPPSAVPGWSSRGDTHGGGSAMVRAARRRREAPGGGGITEFPAAFAAKPGVRSGLQAPSREPSRRPTPIASTVPISLARRSASRIVWMRCSRNRMPRARPSMARPWGRPVTSSLRTARAAASAARRVSACG